MFLGGICSDTGEATSKMHDETPEAAAVAGARRVRRWCGGSL
jgi:hypothetical protein